MAVDTMIERDTAHARLDGDGRLVSAEPILLALNARAGGDLGEPLAVAPLAMLVRLATRLGAPIARRVVVAEADTDLELWVKAQPGADGISLAVSGWREMTPARARATAIGGPEPQVPGKDGDWRWDTDAALRLTFVSLDAAAAIGIDPFAILGQPVTKLFRLDATTGGELPILDALAQRSAFGAQYARLRGSDRLVSLSATVRRDKRGGFAGFIGAAHMVPEPPSVDTDVLSATFTAGLDKALRGPLGRIVANADSINARADGPVDGAYADYAADIANAGRHLLGLVDDLIDLQAIERLDFSLPPETIDLADVARRAAGLLGVRASAAGVTIARPPADATMPAIGDFRRSLQIMVNLIGNAVRYAPAGSTVRVTLAVAEGRVTATVADEGKGIAVADQSRIFGKFERVDPSEIGGNGLGLYIARRLARAMGGDLTVDSAAGEGARFTVALAAA